MNQKLSKKISLYKTAKGFAIFYLVVSILAGIILTFILTGVSLASASLAANGARDGAENGVISPDNQINPFLLMIPILFSVLPLLLIFFILSIVVIVKSGRMINGLRNATLTNPYNIQEQETLTLPVICLFFGLLLPGIFMLVAQSIILESNQTSDSHQNMPRSNPSSQTNVVEKPLMQSNDVIKNQPLAHVETSDKPIIVNSAKKTNNISQKPSPKPSSDAKSPKVNASSKPVNAKPKTTKTVAKKPSSKPSSDVKSPKVNASSKSANTKPKTTAKKDK